MWSLAGVQPVSKGQRNKYIASHTVTKYVIALLAAALETIWVSQPKKYVDAPSGFEALQPSTRYGFSTGMKAQVYASIRTDKRNSDSLLTRPDT
eukprot:3941055-Pleurochrysis_carterae.AAC.2